MSPHYRIFLVLLLLSLSTASFAAQRTTTFLLPITKDHNRLQYYTTFQLGIPPVRIHLSVDLGNPTNWLVGNLAGYNQSTSYKPIFYNTTKCLSYSGVKAAAISCPYKPSPTCNRRFQCMGWATNPRRLDPTYGNGFGLDPLVDDVVSPIYYRHSGNTILKTTTIPRFPFVVTAETGPLKGLSQVSKGILTLSNTPMAIHTQISKTFTVPRKFALCLPSSSSAGVNGVVYFGGGPYFLPPSTVDLSKSMAVTSFISNTHSKIDAYHPDDPAVDYYIKIISIKIDGTPVTFNSSLLSIDGGGDGGSRLSTMVPYTKLHPEIYKAFVDVFVRKAKALNMSVVGPVGSFKTCFDSRSMEYKARTGKGVPVIELVMEGNATWKIYGSNSMVKAWSDAHCLAVFDAGRKASRWVMPAIVIGGKQMEDNLVEIDLEASTVGVTSSLLRLGSSCSQFKGN